MADDKTPNAEFIGRVAGDAKNPTEARMLTGWFGDAGEEGFRRLYTDAELTSFVDIPDDAILFSEPIRDVQPAGAVLVWIKRDAAIKQGGSAFGRAAAFLQGQIQQDFGGGGGAAAQEGGSADAANAPNIGGCWPCITAIPHCAEPTGFTGKCTHQPWPNPSQHVVCTILHCPTNDLTCIPQICHIVASGMPGCGGGGVPPEGGGGGGEAPRAEAAVPPTQLLGCGFTKTWGDCKTQLLGCRPTNACPPPPHTALGCPPSRNPICTDLPGCNAGGAGAAARVVQTAPIQCNPSIIDACPSRLCNTEPPTQLCTKIAQACPTQFANPCPTACGVDCQTQQFQCTHVCPPPPSIGIACTIAVICLQGGGGGLQQQAAAVGAGPTHFVDCTAVVCPTIRPIPCPTQQQPCPTHFIDCTAVVCPTIRPIPCPTHQHPCPTQLFCPTHAPFFCLQTRQLDCTRFGPECPVHTPLCPFTPGAPQCPPISGIECPTQFGCPSGIACGVSAACQPGGGGGVQQAAVAGVGAGAGGGVSALPCPTHFIDCTAVVCPTIRPVPCPTHHHNPCTALFCPTHAPFLCLQTHQVACTHIGAQCPSRAPIDCTRFGPECPVHTPLCPFTPGAPQCPPFSGIECPSQFGCPSGIACGVSAACQPGGGGVQQQAVGAPTPTIFGCTQLGIGCPTHFVDCTIVCPTRHRPFCTQFGPQCPSHFECTFLCQTRPPQCPITSFPGCPPPFTQGGPECPPASGFQCPSVGACPSIACNFTQACQPPGGGQAINPAALAGGGGGAAFGAGGGGFPPTQSPTVLICCPASLPQQCPTIGCTQIGLQCPTRFVDCTIVCPTNHPPLCTHVGPHCPHPTPLCQTVFPHLCPLTLPQQCPHPTPLCQTLPQICFPHLTAPPQCPLPSGFQCPSVAGCPSIACGVSQACQPGGGGFNPAGGGGGF